MNAKKLRLALGYSGRGAISAFAADLGVPVKTVRKWDTGDRTPDTAARNLMRVYAWMHAQGILRAWLDAKEQFDLTP